jgi:hypothetical protein
MSCHAPTLEEVFANADSILVREQVNGKWADYSLAQLPLEKRNAYTRMWWGQRRLPVRATNREMEAHA